MKRIDKLPTKSIQHLLEHDGQSPSGKTFHDTRLEELQEIYDQRIEARQAKEQKRLMREHLKLEGVTCSKCLLTIPHDQAPQHFYKHSTNPNGFRCYCKKCHIKKVQTNKIKLEDIPF